MDYGVQYSQMMRTVDVLFGEVDVVISVAEAERRLDSAITVGALDVAWLAVWIVGRVLRAARSSGNAGCVRDGWGVVGGGAVVAVGAEVVGGSVDEVEDLCVAVMAGETCG